MERRERQLEADADQEHGAAENHHAACAIGHVRGARADVAEHQRAGL